MAVALERLFLAATDQTHPDRKDKFYKRLKHLIDALELRGYAFVRVDDLLGKCKT